MCAEHSHKIIVGQCIDAPLAAGFFWLLPGFLSFYQQIPDIVDIRKLFSRPDPLLCLSQPAGFPAQLSQRIHHQLLALLSGLKRGILVVTVILAMGDRQQISLLHFLNIRYIGGILVYLCQLLLQRFDAVFNVRHLLAVAGSLFAV